MSLIQFYDRNKFISDIDTNEYKFDLELSISSIVIISVFVFVSYSSLKYLKSKITKYL